MKLRTILYTLLLLPVFAASNSFAQEMEVIYYHNDTLGSPRAATGKDGVILWNENYAPYGKKLENQASEKGNHIGYTGKPHERLTGFTYLNARYYDPVIGRFMAVDPVEYIDNGQQYFQRYTYADNNPYKYTDPSGERIAGNLSDFGDALGRDHIDATEGIGEFNSPDGHTGDGIGIEGIFAMALFDEGLNMMQNPTGLAPDIGMTGIISKKKDSSKNEKHGDRGRAQDKAKEQIDKLEKDLKDAKTKREKIKIKQKIQNIQKTAARKAKGEEHSRGAKR